MSDGQLDLIGGPWKNIFEHVCGHQSEELPAEQWRVCPRCGEMFWGDFVAKAYRTLPDGSREEKVLAVENSIRNFIEQMNNRQPDIWGVS